jgi:hypothetical protein
MSNLKQKNIIVDINNLVMKTILKKILLDYINEEQNANLKDLLTPLGVNAHHVVNLS